MRKIEFNGQSVDAEVMDFETIRAEQWSTYALTDGTIVRAKLVVNEIVKLHGQYNSNGEPMYQVFTGAAVSSQAIAENLKK